MRSICSTGRLTLGLNEIVFIQKAPALVGAFFIGVLGLFEFLEFLFRSYFPAALSSTRLTHSPKHKMHLPTLQRTR